MQKTYRHLMTAFTTATLMIMTPQQAEAVYYVTDGGGCAYDECRTCVNLAPAIALSTVLAVGIIALAVQNSNSHSSHSSSFSSSSSSSSSHVHAHVQ